MLTNIDKEKLKKKKKSAFCLIILVGICRCWEASVISSSRVTYLTPWRLTFLKENLQQTMFSSFTLRILGCFSKVLIAFNIIIITNTLFEIGKIYRALQKIYSLIYSNEK